MHSLKDYALPSVTPYETSLKAIWPAPRWQMTLQLLQNIAEAGTVLVLVL